MNSLGVVILVLLPIIGSGYLLYNTQLMRSLLPDTYRSNHYFRILLLGFFWVLLCDLILAQIPGLPEIIASWESFLFGQPVPVGEAMTTGWQSFLFGAQISLVRISLPLLLAWVMKMLVDFFIPGRLPQAEHIEHLMNLSIMLNKDVELMYYGAGRDTNLLMINTTSGKVYIGWVLQMKLPKGDRQWLHIFPIQIGYWDEKQRLQITSDYVSDQEHYSKLLAEGKDAEFLVEQGIVRPMAIISVKEIISIQRFSYAMYWKEFFSSQE
ncbi:MAG: hypothetical protein OXC81_02955 [Betaproteobacteria bacterium]|nr:hypothetical protein [Betaproteobacteria bacterium]